MDEGREMALHRSERVVEEKRSACMDGRWRRCWEVLRVVCPSLTAGTVLPSAVYPVLCTSLWGCYHQTRAWVSLRCCGALALMHVVM